MADSSLGVYSESQSRGLNRNCKEFTPILSHNGTTWLQSNSDPRSDEFSTIGSALDEILKQTTSEDAVGKGLVSPMPSTAHVTPQLTAVVLPEVLPPPPGYAPIVDDPYLVYPFHLGYKLFVGALPYSVSEMDLFPLFTQFGEILELHVQRDWLGRSKGCAWLRYSTMEECHAAIEALHNNYYLGSMNRPMQLTFASDDKKTGRPRTDSYTSESSGGILSKLRSMSHSSADQQQFTCLDSTGPTAICDESRYDEGSLTVSMFPAQFTNEQVGDLFSQFGPVQTFTRTSAETATVKFVFPRDAQRAKATIDGVALPGCQQPLTVVNETTKM